MSDGEVAAFLASVPLFAGVPEQDLAELGRLLRRRELPAGEILWREGEESSGMLLIVDGRVSLSLSLPGGREVASGSLGPAEILGEIPMVDGGRHTATARAEEPSTVLLLRRADFAALVSRRHATAFAIKRGIARHACERLRAQLESLAAALGGEPSDDDKPPGELEFCPAPDSGYVRRLATFRAFDSLALWAFLTAGRYARCPAGRTLVGEGEVSTACYLTMNGAVEKVIVRGGRRVRVGLAGPGQAFGYESLIDGRPAPTTAITRERCLLLVLPHEPFQRLFHEETIGSHVFLDVINRDVITSLRQALRPQAWLATSLQGTSSGATSTPAAAADPPARR
jgi:CRP-like cAMP-binding protein